MRVLYHYSYSFADLMSPWLCSKLVGREVDSVNKFRGDNLSKSAHSLRSTSKGCNADSFRYYRGFKRRLKKLTSTASRRLEKKDPKLLALGSIIQHAHENDFIWGSGVNPTWQRKVPPKKSPAFFAVRGPLTKDYLEKKYRWDVPDVYGDPGVLISKLYKPEEYKKKNEALVILQHNDEIFPVENYIGDRQKILRCQRDSRTRLSFLEVVDQIYNSELVISSSLHAIIIAEAYGVRARWLRNPYLPSVETESDFKYNDYYLSTFREPYQFYTTVESALAADCAGVDREVIKNLQEGLLTSFPRHLFS